MRMSSPRVLVLFSLLAVVYCSSTEGYIDGSPDDEEVSFTRWLWWVLIFYMFMAQAEVCDEYFVESIKVVVEKYRIPEDVAGATLMALGCNGPELFTNFIALFVTHTDLGVGTIVGSEIFNLLCIVGAAAIVSPTQPLEVVKVAFVRDASFYALSILLLAVSLADSKIQLWEATGLLVCGICFAVSVAYTEKLVSLLCPPDYDHLPLPPSIQKRKSRSIQAVLPPPFHSDSSEDPVLMTGGSPAVEIVVWRHNRLLDSHENVHEMRVVHVGNKGLYYGPAIGVEEDVLSPRDIQGRRISSKGRPMLMRTRSFALNAFQQAEVTQALSTNSAPLLRGPDDVPRDMEVQSCIEYSDVVTARNTAGRSFELDCRGELGDIMTLVVTCASPGHKQELVAELSLRVAFESAHQSGFRSCVAHLRNELSANLPWYHKLRALVSFPITFLLAVTMGWCDCRDVGKKKYWAWAFTISMGWLGIFSYLMCVAADGLYAGFGISHGVLGVTVCALGTSFPNFWASVLMAKEGRSAMAVANALGSNVQNVFLALALPWIAKTAYPWPPHPLEVRAKGIWSSVMWMAATLAVLLLLVLRGGFTLGAREGWVLLVTYLIYVTVAVMQGG